MKTRAMMTVVACLCGLGVGLLAGKGDGAGERAVGEAAVGGAEGTPSALSERKVVSNPAGRALLDEWIALEKEGGEATVEMSASSGRQDGDIELSRVAHRDLKAAIELLRVRAEKDFREATQRADSEKEDEFEQRVRDHVAETLPRQIYDNLFTALCRTDVATAVGLAKDTELWTYGPAKYLFQYVPMDQHGAVVEQIAALDDGEFRRAQLPFALEWWKKTDPQQAEEWARANLDAKREEHADILLGMVEEEIELPQNIELMLESSSAKKRRSWLSKRSKELAEYPIEQIPERANRLLAFGDPAEQRSMAVGLANAWGRVAPEAAAEWAFGIEDSEVRSAALWFATEPWFQSLPTEADAWFSSLPAGRSAQIQAALSQGEGSP